MELIKYRTRDGSERVGVREEFFSIDEVLVELNAGGIGLVWGSGTAEEFGSFCSRNRLTANHRSVVTASGPFSIAQLAFQRSRLPTKERRRIESFLFRDAPNYIRAPGTASPPKSLIGPLEFIRVAERQDILHFIEQEYVSSRRVKEGAQDYIREYLSSITRVKTPSYAVVRLYRSLTIEQLYAAWLCLQRDQGKVVLVVDSRSGEIFDSRQISVSRERKYILTDELIRGSADYFHKRDDLVRIAYNVWTRSLDASSRTLTDRQCLTSTLADRFIDIIALGTFEDTLSDTAPGLPSQRPAPLRFKTTSNGRIDILHDRIPLSETEASSGAIETCRFALDELRQFNNLHNIIPSFINRIDRILRVLQKVEDSEYDAALIVQLGTEIAYLEARVSASKDVINDEVFPDIAASFTVLRGYLAQFEPWSEYCLNISAQKPTSFEAVQIATALLTDLKSNADVATGDAKARIGDYLDGLAPNSTSSESQQGAVNAAENAITQGASRVIAVAKSQGAGVASEFGSAVKKASSEKLAKWVLSNSVHLMRFAEVTGSDWLRNFFDSLKHH